MSLDLHALWLHTKSEEVRKVVFCNMDSGSSGDVSQSDVLDLVWILRSVDSSQHHWDSVSHKYLMVNITLYDYLTQL